MDEAALHAMLYKKYAKRSDPSWKAGESHLSFVWTNTDIEDRLQAPGGS
jgi:hypothetical protein